MRSYRSLDDAWRAFELYMRIEPRLEPLWYLCRRAARPVQPTELIDDTHNVDPFEDDVLAADKFDDGWCAEDYFLEYVKPKVLLLVGSLRPGETNELHSTHAYETIYDLLINWALTRSCACCVEHDDDGWHRGDGGSPAHW
jgi:hypothetical protein